LFANGAFELANTLSSSLVDTYARETANAAYLKANSDGIFANASFVKANSGFDKANSSGTFANGAFVKANSSFGAANSAGIFANSAFETANSINIYSTGAFDVANGAFETANAGFESANSAGVFANSAFDTANSSYLKANSSGNFANGAFVKANSGALFANASYLKANSDGLFANAAFIKANSGFDAANSAALFANGAFDLANTFSEFVVSAFDTANTAALFANGAFETANSGFNTANSSGTFANGAFIKANSGFDKANSAGTFSNGAFVKANSGFDKANSAALFANGAFITANSGFDTANSAGIFANGAFDTANSAGIFANGTFVKANSGFDKANSAALFANGAFITANSSGIFANGAFSRANNSLNVQTGGTITGDVTVTGNLFINGTTTSINTTVVQTTDSLIKLANNNIYSDTLDIGFYGTALTSGSTAPTYHGLARQAGSNNFLLFKGLTQDPSTNVITPGTATSSNVGTLIANIAGYSITSNGVDLFAYTTTAFTQANTANSSATSAGLFANGAFVKANNALPLTGGTISGDVVIQQNFTVQGNVTFTGNATSYQITGNTGQFFGYAANGFNALYAGVPTGYLVQPQTVQQLTSNYDGYTSINMQNINTAPNASFDMFITADNGTSLEGYLDIGLGSSTYNYGDPFTLIKPNDGYFFVHGNTVTNGGNTIIGSIHNDIVFATGGAGSLNVEDEVLRINTQRNIVFKGNLISTSSANVALGNVSNVHIYGGNTGQLLTTDGTGNISFIDLPTPNTVTYLANTLIQTNGVYVSGNLWSTQVFGDYTATNGVYVLTDGTGSAPAWYIDFDFINVVKFNRVVMNINYTQASGHTIYVQLYNFVTSAWDNIGTYTGLGSYYAFALEVIDETAYVSGLSKVQLRLYHSNAGNAAHQTSIDYIALEQSYQGPQGPRGPTGATGATGATGNGVSSGGTVGQVLIKNSSTNYDTVWSNNLIDSYTTANSAFLQANSAFDAQNNTAIFANSAFIQANTANSTAVSAGVFANGAFNQANTANSTAVSAGVFANSAFIQANTANSTAVSAGVFANGAFNQANTAISDALAYSIALG